MTRLVRGNSKQAVLVTAILAAPYGATKLKFGKRMGVETWLIEYDPALDGYSIYQLSVELGLQLPIQPIEKPRVAKPWIREAIHRGKTGFVLGGPEKPFIRRPSEDSAWEMRLEKIRSRK